MPETKLAPRFRVQVPGWDPRAFRKRTSIYELGKNELEGIGQIVLSNPVATDVECASALLDLADWHVLFNRPHQGIQIYREAWDLLEHTPDLLAHAFDEPNLIHMNVTRSYVSPDRASGRPEESRCCTFEFAYQRSRESSRSQNCFYGTRQSHGISSSSYSGTRQISASI